MTTVLLVDDRQSFRESVRAALGDHGIVIESEVGAGRGHIDLTAPAQQEDLDVVVVVTAHEDATVLRRALRAGACGFVVGDCRIDELMHAVRVAVSEESLHGLHLKMLVVAHLSRGQGEAPRSVSLRPGWLNGREPAPADLLAKRPQRFGEAIDAGLTSREVEVLQSVTDGCDTSEVAVKLDISRSTVKKHLASIYQKLAVRDRTEAVVQAIRRGIVQVN